MNLRASLVSIVLPNLNYVAFLEERTKSILSQSFSNWEGIVVDGYPSAGIDNCCLRLIDEKGIPQPSERRWGQ